MQQINDAKISRLKTQSNVPLVYIDWIERNGFGSFGAAGFMVYDGLVPLHEFNASAPNGYLAFGDDMSGISSCFSTSGSETVYEWDSATNTITSAGIGFLDYVARYA